MKEGGEEKRNGERGGGRGLKGGLVVIVRQRGKREREVRPGRPTEERVCKLG